MVLGRARSRSVGGARGDPAAGHEYRGGHNAVKAELANIEKELPKSVVVNTLYDRSISIDRAVSDTKFSLELALVLVVLVIFLFLRNLTATIIPSLALPMAVVGTFSVMYLLNFSIDTLSLMALTLAVGLCRR